MILFDAKNLQPVRLRVQNSSGSEDAEVKSLDQKFSNNPQVSAGAPLRLLRRGQGFISSKRAEAEVMYF